MLRHRAVTVAAAGLALYAACRAVALVLEAQSMAAAVGQALLVEWGGSRLGVAWSAPEAKAAGEHVRRVGVGLVVGLGLVGAACAVLVVTGAVAFERVAQLEPSVLAIGLATAALHAWRDEFVLHGIPLRAFEGTTVPPAGRALACGLTSAGAALGQRDATARSVFVALLIGIVLGALWRPGQRAGGAWAAWAAHTTVRWSVGTLLAGGLAHARLADDAWAGGGLLGGTAAAIALAPLGVLALARSLLRNSPRLA